MLCPNKSNSGTSRTARHSSPASIATARVLSLVGSNPHGLAGQLHYGGVSEALPLILPGPSNNSIQSVLISHEVEDPTPHQCPQLPFLTLQTTFGCLRCISLSERSLLFFPCLGYVCCLEGKPPRSQIEPVLVDRFTKVPSFVPFSLISARRELKEKLGCRACLSDNMCVRQGHLSSQNRCFFHEIPEHVIKVSSTEA